MWFPIVFHIELNTAVLPVKWTPASDGCTSAWLEMAVASPGTKLITPGGSPASIRVCITYHEERTAVDAGFQTTPHPMSAGAPDRLPPIAVKLNGETAYTNPSSPR